VFIVVVTSNLRLTTLIVLRRLTIKFGLGQSNDEMLS